MADGSLDFPDELLGRLDFAVAAIHSGFKKNVTDRMIRALENPHVRTIAREAIACQGDTFSDYRTAHGESGSYQDNHRVYQRHGEPCRRCATPIVRIRLGGRSCHFCPACQK